MCSEVNDRFHLKFKVAPAFLDMTGPGDSFYASFVKTYAQLAPSRRQWHEFKNYNVKYYFGIPRAFEAIPFKRVRQVHEARTAGLVDRYTNALKNVDVACEKVGAAEDALRKSRMEVSYTTRLMDDIFSA